MTNLQLPHITWRELPPLNDGAKPRKVPFNLATGVEADPHDPSWWMDSITCAETISNGNGLDLRPGVVLSDGDPYFLLDLDDCYDTSTGQWDPGVQQVLSHFPGAAVETSINGRGLHVVGQCSPAALGERRNKFKLYEIDCEFYHTKRFIALGHGFTGNPDLDFTNSLVQIVPERLAVESLALIDQAAPEYSGPDNDDQLINMMLNSRGSTAAMFGNKATVKQLWEAQGLSQFYPSVSGDDFDRSSADAALMSHLAFWTGKNTERMDRLFRRSGLMREKYEKRGDYRTSTISGSVANCRNVYSRPSPVIGIEQNSDGKSIEQHYGEIVTIDQQAEFFKGCVYVVQNHKIMIPGGELLDSPRFKAMYGGHTFLMSADGTKPTTNAFEAFTENRVVKNPKVMRTRFKPREPHGIFVEPDGVNVYNPPVIATIEGDPSPLLDLLQRIMPVENDRLIFLSWCAAVVQNPGVKILWSPVLQGTEGNGKSVWGEVLAYCMGERYSWTVSAEKIDSKFNNYVQNRLFINVEEMNVFEKWSMMDTLKNLITGNKQEVELKNIDAFMDPDYCANWYFATNHRNSIVKTRNDRRFAMFFTAQQTMEDLKRSGLRDNDYFPKLWHWLRQSDGFAIMRHYLLNFQIPAEYDPTGKCFMAPETSSTNEAIGESYTVSEQYVIDAVEGEKQGFKGGWTSSWQVSRLLRENHQKVSPRSLGMMLEKLGYMQMGRATTPIMHEENNRAKLYVQTNIETSGIDATIAYQKAQGWM